MAAVTRRQALASAGAVIVAGAASCAPISALAARDPFLDALAAYKAIEPDVIATDDARGEAWEAARAAYPERPVWPLYVGKDGPEREVFPGDVNENGKPYRFDPLPRTVEELWEARDRSHASRGLTYKDGAWVQSGPMAPERIAASNKKYEALARKIEAWQAECRTVDAACGVPEAEARASAVEDRLTALYDAMTATAATTPAGILARLEFFRGEQGGCAPETLDAIIADVRCMIGGTA